MDSLVLFFVSITFSISSIACLPLRILHPFLGKKEYHCLLFWFRKELSNNLVSKDFASSVKMTVSFFDVTLTTWVTKMSLCVFYQSRERRIRSSRRRHKSLQFSCVSQFNVDHASSLIESTWKVWRIKRERNVTLHFLSSQDEREGNITKTTGDRGSRKRKFTKTSIESSCMKNTTFLRESRKEEDKKMSFKINEDVKRRRKRDMSFQGEK